MMTRERELLQQALDALDRAISDDRAHGIAASPEVPARKPLAQVNRYCSAGMCLTTDREHEADCPRAASPEQPK